MSQAAQEFDEMKPWYDRMHALLVEAPAMRETVQMFCRIGYCPDQQHTPRRELGSIIRTDGPRPSPAQGDGGVVGKARGPA